jgi:hypothetical protein
MENTINIGSHFVALTKDGGTPKISLSVKIIDEVVCWCFR